MAGDYTPMDHDLPDSPEFIAIIEATGERTEMVFFQLWRFWTLADRHVLNSVREHNGELMGVLKNCGPSALAARCGGTKEFWLSVAEVTPSEECPNGWLIFEGKDTLIPGWEKRFSNTAKRRRTEAQKKKRQYWNRKRKRATPGESAGENREAEGEVDGRTTGRHAGDAPGESAGENRGELRTSPARPRDQNQNHKKINTSFGRLEFPDSLRNFDTQPVRDAAIAWISQLAAKSKFPIDPRQTIFAAIQGYATAEDFVSAVYRAIGNNWASLQPAPQKTAESNHNEPPAPTGPKRPYPVLKPRRAPKRDDAGQPSTPSGDGGNPPASEGL